MLNRTCVMGRLTKDPELRKVEGGGPVCHFSLAIDRNFLSRDGERKADFVDITAWGLLAEFVSRNFEKGDSVVVEGEIRSSARTDKAGVKHYNVGIAAEKVFFGPPRKASGVSSGSPEEEEK